ncbi:MAG TPA: RNA polymerase sigma-70 factor [Prolixibacteraceae bacterium]|nr:RNA polymerase sigma-70 factor [Prolixibacteraceae bacterium]
MKVNELSDNVLFEKIAQNNVLAFDTLFVRYYKKLCYYSNKITCKNEISEEVVQDVFVKLWESREFLHIEKSIKSYLYRSVYNLSVNAIRNNKKLNKSVEIDSNCIDFKSYDNADNDILLNELEYRLFETINLFPEKQKNVFILKRFDGLSYKQISAELNMSERMVEKYVSKSLVALRNELIEYKNPTLPYFIFIF